MPNVTDDQLTAWEQAGAQVQAVAEIDLWMSRAARNEMAMLVAEGPGRGAQVEGGDGVGEAVHRRLYQPNRRRCRATAAATGPGPPPAGRRRGAPSASRHALRPSFFTISASSFANCRAKAA